MPTRIPAADLARSVSRYIRRFLVGLGVLFVVVTLTPLDTWWAKCLAGPRNDPAGDVLIVLAGSCLGNGIIGENSYWRSVYAELAWREDGFRTIVLSGGPSSAPCAGAMRSFIVAEGVPPASIMIETQSHSTRENALFTIPLLNEMAGRKVLLTSDYHMFRASRVFRKLGVGLLPRPIPDALKRAQSFRGRWGVFLDLVEETAKIIYYKSRGWI
jgi:uncharacterized SAM-binding protein YcdF (DUF218 family)